MHQFRVILKIEQEVKLEESQYLILLTVDAIMALILGLVDVSIRLHTIVKLRHQILMICFSCSHKSVIGYAKLPKLQVQIRTL
jgi:hypothetical protein